MKTRSEFHRGPMAGLFMTAIIVLMGMFWPGMASAQYNCGPCLGNQTYRVTVSSTWPIPLGGVTPTVHVEDAVTGTVITYVHSYMTPGSTVTQTFYASNPSRPYTIADVGLTFCSGQILLPVTCTNYPPGSPYIYCFSTMCNGKYYCIKITFSPGTGGAGQPCWNINLDAVQTLGDSCPGNFCPQ